MIFGIVIFQNCLKFRAMNNFEISPVVLMPNINTNHAITYTNTIFKKKTNIHYLTSKTQSTHKAITKWIKINVAKKLIWLKQFENYHTSKQNTFPVNIRVWARIWSLGDNLSPWQKFWGTFSFLGGQKFVHPSADAKGFVFLAGLLIGLARKSQILRDF